MSDIFSMGVDPGGLFRASDGQLTNDSIKSPPNFHSRMHLFCQIGQTDSKAGWSIAGQNEILHLFSNLAVRCVEPAEKDRPGLQQAHFPRFIVYLVG
jgi:hypothetical protein